MPSLRRRDTMTSVTTDRDVPPTRYQRWMAESPRRAKVLFLGIASLFVALAAIASVAYGAHTLWWTALAVAAVMGVQWGLVGQASQHVRQFDERHRGP